MPPPCSARLLRLSMGARRAHAVGGQRRRRGASHALFPRERSSVTRGAGARRRAAASAAGHACCWRVAKMKSCACF
jgi:hypothetical protein